MMFDWSSAGWGWMFFGGIFMLIFWCAIIGVIIWGIVQLVRKGQPSSSATKTHYMETLKERYAKGEISKEEFDQMKKDLLS
ncbi:MAG: SHOCT domain-containing protein [Dehalococcoides mccartyi]|uniref:SHOCT domain-containing protein n=1 Tax=Dehalococcoides TaxID=61434 RepID=UPI001A05952B|nr:SHOCT domain-containing protein [Dehalococcoides mccartyi]MBF4483017.1 SHOCT domain-containing protein [Dehalococcoides mccartyi]MBJ7531983.1 SHOCT domain-containing protein [Dehalococcoides mccartyi]MDP4280313.1 SHOCT domain-containing protein [Dehalococcoides mccartyi]